MARKPELPKRSSKITIPNRCNPIAKIVFAEMKRQSRTYDDIEYRSGVLRSTIKAWRKDNTPGLETVDAVLGALGWSLMAIPQLENVPPDVRDLLNAAAARWGEVNPLLCELMSTVSRGPILGVIGSVSAASTSANRKARRRWAAHPDQVVIFPEAEAA